MRGFDLSIVRNPFAPKLHSPTPYIKKAAAHK